MSTITKIQAQNRDKSRVNIYIDEVFACGLSAEIVVTQKLKVGAVIDVERLNALVIDDEKSFACQKLLGILARKKLTERQARQKLQAKQYMCEAVECAIKMAKEYGYIDDLAYAQEYITYYGTKGGSLKVKQALYLAGVSSDIISEVLSEFDEDDSAYQILRTLAADKDIEDRQQKEKLMRRMAAKGFTYSAVQEAFYRLKQEE